LKGIIDNNPLTVAALHRVLLAIIHRAVDGPATSDDWSVLWRGKSFLNTPVLEYLEEKRERFDLFSEQYPFYQTAGFSLDSPTTSQKLLHELATANNKTLFDHNLDTHPAALKPDQAARALITAQMYSFGGGQGATSERFGKTFCKHPNFAHAPLVFGALILIQGENLFETLMLNLLRYSKEDNQPIPCTSIDAPVWEIDTINTPMERVSEGYLDYLTWRSRHIRLLPEEENGETVVRFLYMAQGDIIHKQFHERIPGDPMFAYSQGKDGNRYAIKLDAERSFWRDSAALFEFGAGQDSKKYDDRPLNVRRAAGLKSRNVLPKGALRCNIIGIANDKANPLYWRMEQFTVPSEILEDVKILERLKDALRFAEDVGLTVRSQTRSLAQYVLAPDGRKADTKAVTRLASALGTEAQYWARLDASFREFLSGLTEEGLRNWYKKVKNIAFTVFDETTGHYLSHSARELQAQARATGWLRFEVNKAYKDLNLDDGDFSEEVVEEEGAFS
jgi:CRISPR system Cascade subunit CasA